MLPTIPLVKVFLHHSIVRRALSLISSSFINYTNPAMSQTKRDAPSSSNMDSKPEDTEYGLE